SRCGAAAATNAVQRSQPPRWASTLAILFAGKSPPAKSTTSCSSRQPRGSVAAPSKPAGPIVDRCIQDTSVSTVTLARAAFNEGTATGGGAYTGGESS